MIKILAPPANFGLEQSLSSLIKIANVQFNRKQPVIHQLTTLQEESPHVKQLYIDHPVLTTGLGGNCVLVRSLFLPLTKDKDIEAALPFQVEPLLPYPIEEAVLSYQIISKGSEGTLITLLCVHRDALVSHLTTWHELQIEPEKIASVHSALAQFATFFLPEIKSCIFIHMQFHETSCVLVQEGKLIASFAQPIGLRVIASTLKKSEFLPINEEDWIFLSQEDSPLGSALKQLRNEVTKLCYAVAKEFHGEKIEGILVTGDLDEFPGLDSFLVTNLSFPLLELKSTSQYSAKDLINYACPIGLALGSLAPESEQINFRQKEWIYPRPWDRLKIPILSYFAAMLLMSGAFYFFSQQYLQNKEYQLKQDYLDLLANVHKSHEQFELAFSIKNPLAHEQFGNELPAIKQLSLNDLMDRLTFLQKELQASPDSFPLFANVPRVSDTLAWLNQHSMITSTGENGEQDIHLLIDNFSYTMIKRPQHGKKQEKYQVKIDLEFTSPTPKLAREFHDILIAPNDWVDPKGEVKWSSNRGKYKTSFFLKDKTIYPST